MPLYYNPAAPTNATKNSITKTATDFGLRDFLLHKNIQNPIRYPQLSTSINGAPRGGEPFLDTMVGTGIVIQHNPLTVEGIPRYQSAIISNQYKNDDPNAPLFLSIENQLKTPIFNATAPNGISNYQQVDIEQYGILAKSNEKNYRKISTLKNLYVDATKQIDMADMVSLQPQQTAQQLTGYIDEYGGLNLGGSAAIQAADVIGSVFNGGLGLAKGGIVTNYDIRASLAGRVLTATGLINDTKLGIIGGQQLALSLANNAAFNTQQLLLGTIDVQDNILSLVKEGQLSGFRPSYKITIPKTTGGRILDSTEKILGFTIPKSYLDDDGSIFSYENKNAANIDRANAMLLNTGKGQVQSLLKNIQTNINGINEYDKPKMFRSGYAPSFKDNRGRPMVSNPSIYAFTNKDDAGNVINLVELNGTDPIPSLSYNRENLMDNYGFTSPNNQYGNGTNNIKQPTFSWASEVITDTSNQTTNVKGINIVNQDFKDLTTLPSTTDKKSLLSKTQKLFNSKGMKTIVSAKGDMTISNGSQIQTAVAANGGGISKGSGVLSSLNFDRGTGMYSTLTGRTADNTFCRAWTTFNRYESVRNLIRQRGLNQSEGDKDLKILNNKWRLNTLGSVLDDNGFVKIAPYKTDDLTRRATSPKKYMFSIENLAWAGSPAAMLLPSEQGPGDLLTGKFGRIMWFPPYDLTFTETSAVNLESTNFIGRGEPVYTYNNTERTGNLTFKVIVDHPSIMNSFAGTNGPNDDFIRSWFAGCVDLPEVWANKLTVEEKTKREVRKIKKTVKKKIEPIGLPDSFKIYFRNDISTIDTAYESGSATHISNGNTVAGIGDYNADTKYTLNHKQRVWPDNTDYGLNKTPIKILEKQFTGWMDPEYNTYLLDYMINKCQTCVINIDGHASAQGYSATNSVLSIDRANEVRQYLISNGVPSNRIKVLTESSGQKNSGGYNGDTSPDQKAPKMDRYAQVIFVNNQIATEIDDVIEVDEEINRPTVNEEVSKRFFSETNFFEKLTNSDYFVFDTIREKIKYFHPAFHSMTPEGLNSRLTFLLQCTRQGATYPGAGPRNLAFGQPPVCILRIGDFYNTKIMIDNVSFDFEENLWDLNPEGVGVQPMIANVNISFKYIGGSSLLGPINKLQNALSFNYFANTQVYDPRADYIALDTMTNEKGDSVINLRQTNGTDDPSNQNNFEYGYKLVSGLDPTRQSMGKFDNEVDVSKTKANSDANQIKASDVATNPVQNQQISGVTANTITTSDDLSKLKLVSAEAITTFNGTEDLYDRISFIIERRDKTNIPNLKKDYDVKAIIQNLTKTDESYQIKLDDKFLKTDDYRMFQVILDETTHSANTPVVLDATNNYTIKVELVGLKPFNNNVTF
jgi:hypothetical protein